MYQVKKEHLGGFHFFVYKYKKSRNRHYVMILRFYT